MKQVVSISFLFVFFWQSLFQTAYIGYWKLNQDKIIKTKCINRFKPMMHCNGKCQLYRQLKKAADEEAENNKLPVAVLKLKSLDTFILQNIVWQCTAFESSDLKATPTYLATNLKKGHSLSLFKPPQLHYNFIETT